MPSASKLLKTNLGRNVVSQQSEGTYRGTFPSGHVDPDVLKELGETTIFSGSDGGASLMI